MTSSSELVFNDLKISRENILGARGRGLLNVLDFLDESRIEIGAQALGNCEGAFLKALQHARERTQFQRPIINFQAIQDIRDFCVRCGCRRCGCCRLNDNSRY